jgi:hypothetical protein
MAPKTLVVLSMRLWHRRRNGPRRWQSYTKNIGRLYLDDTRRQRSNTFSCRLCILSFILIVTISVVHSRRVLSSWHSIVTSMICIANVMTVAPF